MQSNKKIHISTVIMIIITFISLAFTGVFGALYINEADEVSRLTLENERLEAELVLPAVSDEVETIEAVSDSDTDNIESDTDVTNNSGDYVEVTANIDMDEDEISALLQKKEDEVEAAIKERMKSLVMSEDGTPLKMLRSFFPENLIYADKNEYVFAPVLEGLKKHNLLAENFVKTDNGEMQYVEDGNVISHKGIDVSKYQGIINWQEVKADGVEYAFIRLGMRGYGSGKLVLDEYYLDNISGANAAGVSAGIYMFTQAVTVEEAKEEAAFVLENIEGYDVRCPIVFDVEMITDGDGRANGISQQERTDITIAFCEAVKEAGYTPMVYGNVKCFTKMLDMTRLEDYEKWYAFYDDYMYMPYDVSCWQYSEKGSVAGIKGKVDLNIAYKTW